MLANNITPSTIQITKKMQTDYKCARTKYEIYLEQEKKRRRAKSKTITKHPSLVKKLMKWKQ